MSMLPKVEIFAGLSEEERAERYKMLPEIRREN